MSKLSVRRDDRSITVGSSDEKANLVVRDETEWAIDSLQMLAGALAETGAFGTNDPSVILAKLLAARDFGIAPIRGLFLFHHFDNSLTPDYKLLAALIRMHPRYDFIVTDWTNKSVTIWPKVDGDFVRHPVTNDPISVTVTFKECLEAGFPLDKSGKLKPAWRSHPNMMILSQALKRAVPAYFPDVLAVSAAVGIHFDDVEIEVEPIAHSDEEDDSVARALQEAAGRSGVSPLQIIEEAVEALGENPDASMLIEWLASYGIETDNTDERSEG